MQDPLKYFRIEAREILEQLQTGLLELERSGARVDTTQRLLRQAHTLKGAARVVKQLEIANLAHRLEDLIVPWRDAERPLSPAEIEGLLAVVDAIGQQVSSLAPAPAPQPQKAPESRNRLMVPGSAPAPSEEPLRSSVAPLEQVDALMDGVAELGFQLGGMRHAVPDLGLMQRLAEELSERLEPRRLGELGPGPGTIIALRGLASELETRLGTLEREVATSFERTSRELSQVRDRVDQLRLVAAASIFSTLERTARDAAVSLDKQASFEAHGGDIRLDATVLTAVQRALVQAVRNAVAHGIEPTLERGKSGKPPVGRVTLEVQRRGRQICFLCRDDGRGVDLGKVRSEAHRLGRLPNGAASTNDRQLLDLLLHGGISTTARPTEVSGRGVGLDLIREALAGVSGSVTLTTEAGSGTSLILTVPASLSALEALVVEAAGELHALPLASVVQAKRVESAELSHTTSEISLLFQGQVIPFVPLSALLRNSSDPPERAIWSAVIVRGQRGLLAIGVDRLLGSETLVARSLPDSLDVDGTVAGVTLDADGNPRLLLDPDELLLAARHLPQRSAKEAPQKRAILVIDDSLTTRMLEQSILESAGYEVELASSGEEGLARARARRYDLILVDVEMPNMDGFTFLEHIRADSTLASVPAVLVTSRASAEDLARGKAAGANGHVAKGEFDQVDFLERIERLMR